MLLVADDFDLDKADPRLGLDGRRQAPHGILQEHLNASDPALWGVVANGAKLRVLRDNASLTRPAYIEADLDLIFSEELYPDFAALWLAAHASRLEPRGGKASSCVLESWRAKAHETGERVREKLRAGVEDALRRLGGGFIEHPGNDRLRARIASGRLSTEGYHQQLLRLVYRLLFLFSAEERGALHPPDASEEARAVYREGYALSRLRERALRRRHYDKNADLWTGLKVVFQALASDGEEDLGLPALGGLFRLGQCADLDAAALENAPLLEAAHRLTFFSAGSGLSRVNYRDMDTEELGSVYESLLELHPVIDVDTRPWSFSFATDAGASERKRTGSYYTPPSLVAELIKSTLDPVIEKTVKDNRTNPTDALLELKILDPACGSGHFLLAAARRVALEAARMESDSDAPEENVRRHFLREVVRRCVHGVDVNPLAVELCRTALWIEALEPGKPLSFLDAHVVQGDSLVGILDPEIMSGGIPDAAYAPLQDDDKAVCAALRKRNRQRAQRDLFDQEAADQVAVDFGEIEAMPEGTVPEINAKRAAHEAAKRKAENVQEQLRADLFVGAFFAPKTRDAQDVVPLTSDIHRIDEDAPARKGVRELAGELSGEHGFLHWHLEFADVMRGGGFDVVLANPPWGRVKLQQKKFFALRRPRIALARNKAQREQMINHLVRDGAPPADVDLHEAFVAATRNAGATSQFARTSQRFPLTGRGDVNTYALFAEAVLQLAAPEGRAGLIVPTGIAADHSTRDFFNHVVSKKRLASLHGFENRKRIFRNIGTNSRFCLLALGGRDAPAAEAEFAYFLHDPEQLKEAERRIKLSEADFRLFNPNTRTCPMFRTRRDMEIARKMYERAGVLWKEARGGEPEHNPWGVKFSTMFHMSNDSKLFRTRRQLEDDGWTLEGNTFVRDGEAQLPLYEAKMFHQYDHRFATFDGASEADLRKGKARLMTVDEKADSNSFPIPRYWVAEQLVLDRLDKTGFSTTRAKRFSRHPDIPTSRHPDIKSPCVRSPAALRGGPKSGARYQLPPLATRRSFSPLDFVNTENRASHGSTYHGSKSLADNRNERRFPVDIDQPKQWYLCFRDITSSAAKRTTIVSLVSNSGLNHHAPFVDYATGREVLSALAIANFNSLPLDWAARSSIGGVNMSVYILKQLPVLPPDIYRETSPCGVAWLQLILPRVLELTYTSIEMKGFADDLGYSGPPFRWNEERRHGLKSELDAIFAHMYGLDRSEVEWILDPPSPSVSFPTLKKNELEEFGEYRTRRLVLAAFDALDLGEEPVLVPSTRRDAPATAGLRRTAGPSLPD